MIEFGIVVIDCFVNVLFFLFFLFLIVIYDWCEVEFFLGVVGLFRVLIEGGIVVFVVIIKFGFMFMVFEDFESIDDE